MKELIHRRLLTRPVSMRLSSRFAWAGHGGNPMSQIGMFVGALCGFLVIGAAAGALGYLAMRMNKR